MFLNCWFSAIFRQRITAVMNPYQISESQVADFQIAEFILPIFKLPNDEKLLVVKWNLKKYINIVYFFTIRLFSYFRVPTFVFSTIGLYIGNIDIRFRLIKRNTRIVYYFQFIIFFRKKRQKISNNIINDVSAYTVYNIAKIWS